MTELETVIDFTDKSKTAFIYTRQHSLLRKLDAAMKSDSDIKVVGYGKTWRTYEVPKKYIQIIPKLKE